MSNKMYYTVTSIIFLIIGLAHALRFAMGWPALIGEYEVPLWMSGVASLLALYLSARGFGAMGRASGKKRSR